MTNLDISVTSTIPQSICCECGKPSNRVGGPGNPSEGDFNLCIECGSLNIFASDLSLRRPTTGEMLEAAADSDLQHLRRLIATSKLEGNMDHHSETTAPPIRHETAIAIDDRLIPRDEHSAMIAKLRAVLNTEDILPPVFIGSRRPKALKVGIAKDLLDHYPDADGHELSDWLEAWTGHTAYLQRIAHGRHRHDLAGYNCGKITPSQRDHAFRILRDQRNDN